jgi:hypothetical protein
MVNALRLWLWGRDKYLDSTMVYHVAARVCVFDQDLMPPRRKALHNDRTSGRICPMPRGVIDPDADVPSRETQALDVVPNEHNTARERFG